jgi:polyisoprenoid-binding protein YceI
MATATPVRTYQGQQLPEPGTYDLDTSHTTVEFVGRHLGLAKVRGRFTTFNGRVQIADVPEDSSVEVEIDVASVNSADQRRDEHLRSPDFFDVENHPKISFRSLGVKPASDGTWDVKGDLTVRGITKPVVLHVEFEGGERDPWGGRRIGFSASTEVDREDWDLTWNQILESGGLLVGKKIKIELAVEAVQAS